METIKRKIDELGRIVIPMEARQKLELNANDEIEIKIEEDKIIMEKAKN